MAHSTISVDVRHLFSDLGKATKRGVRKCPQCGTQNGTRGVSCKNRSCSHVFKDIGPERRRLHLDPCKLITDTPGLDVFSVKHREKGQIELRGLVKLQMQDCLDDVNDPSQFVSTTARASCHVEGCSRANLTVIVPMTGTWETFGDSDDLACCNHVLSCLQTSREAQPFAVKHSVLNLMSISADWKQNIWLKARSDGPLVQRVSQTVMVVKSDDELGYLHTYFFSPPSSGSRSSDPPRFSCSCQSRRSTASGNSPRKRGHNLGPLHQSNSSEAVRCIHFYSCLAVFSGDSKLSKEFSKFIVDDKVVSSMEQVMAILGQDADGRQVQVEVLDESILNRSYQVDDGARALDDSRIGTEELEFQIEMEEADGTIRTISLPSKSLGVISEDLFSGDANEFMCSQNPELKPEELNEDPSPVSMSSLEWLASVTERINQTMHYQFEGNPSPLVFNVPQKFFTFLRDRLSCGRTKRRLPNSMSTFVRTEAPPVGTFTKSTWYINNVFQVKSIFDNPFVQLDVTRRFVMKKDETFEFAPGSKPVFNSNDKVKPDDEFKTFLRVGQMSPDPNDVIPFVIEWIPDILPKMKVGELRILFKYGHQKNGRLDQSKL